MPNKEAVRAEHSTDSLVRELLQTEWTYWRNSWEKRPNTPSKEVGLRVREIQALLRNRPAIEVSASLTDNMKIHRTLVILHRSGEKKPHDQSPLKTQNRFVIALLERVGLVASLDAVMTQKDAISYLTTPDYLGEVFIDNLLGGPHLDKYRRRYPRFSKNGIRVLIPNDRADNLYRIGSDLYGYWYNFYDGLH